MIPMSELLKDRFYREFLERVPKLPEVAKSKQKAASPPWVVYVQREREGKWGRRSFWKYKKALKFMLRHLELGAYDAALNCRRVGFYPPSRLVRIKGKFIAGTDGVKRQATKLIKWELRGDMLEGQPDHHWCMYCRRPTVFRHYKRHRAMGPIELDQSTPRCSICGASARIAVPESDRRFKQF
jgi:hypothetical protein